MKKSIFKRLISFVLFIGIIGACVAGYFYNKHFITKNISFTKKEVFLFIPKNSTQKSVFKQIKKLEITKDFESFKWLAKKKNYRGKNIVFGNYKIQNNWSNNQLINHLRAGNGRLDATVHFNNVRTLRNLADEMSKEIELDSDEIHSWLINPENAKKYGFNKQTIVSMFLPNTYRVDFDISVDALMKRMAKEYKKFWNKDRVAKLKKCNLTQSECATLASIVFSETNSKKDQKTIAGVYMNRLRIGMPLQADPTLIFALDDYTIRRVLIKHKKVDSPYNTYMYKGLPPGPINIPPASYLDAVLDYEKHDYLYFVAKEDLSGESNFAKTYSQHLIYARKYQNMLNKRR